MKDRFITYCLFAGYGRVQKWELNHLLQEAKQLMGIQLRKMLPAQAECSWPR